MIYDYIILGAGISGALLAANLRHLNASVLVVDKGRSVGGRLSCKRIGDVSFNHGIQNFQCVTQKRTWITDLMTENFIESTFPHKILVPANQIIKKILNGTMVTVATEINAIQFLESFYEITCMRKKKWRAKKIICTFPAAQALRLLNPLLSLENIAALKSAKYSCKLACFIASPLTVPISTDYSFEQIGNNQMVTFSDAISEELFELTEVEIIMKLQNKFKILNYEIKSELITLKKWRYAQCFQPAATSFLTCNDNNLIVSGDAFGKPSDSSLERAISSAESILAFLHSTNSF